ncbi:MAG: homocysteine S-methyltransferase family protein, partial [Solobacterium sp.]|nr:homocysteine S-methyltransferase family protein [Solobacterium sp.]
NCSVGPDQMVPQLKRLKEIARVPLIAKANAGVPELVNGKTVYNCPPEEYASHIEAMAEAGVMIYGGCCGTAAEHIAAIKEKLAQVEIGRPAPADNGLLPAATEKELFFLDPGVGIGKVLECGDDLEDDLEEELESDDVVVAIAIRSEDELDNFADCQYMISKPLCLVCDDAVLLEQALRLYQGRALYEGTLSEEKLQPLQKKYGLIY